MFSLILAGLLGYFLGSIPAAFLFVRWKSDLDIRSAGSGNVGTLNSYEVTGSLPVGAAVLIIDAVKGMVAVILARVIAPGEFRHEWVAGIASILGHNFPVWLGFRGGRGLATAAGVFSLLCWPFVPAWGILWCAGFALLGDVNASSAAASVALPLIVAFIPGRWLELITAGQAGETRIWTAGAFLLVLVKLLAPVGAYIRRRRTKRRMQGEV